MSESNELLGARWWTNQVQTHAPADPSLMHTAFEPPNRRVRHAMLRLERDGGYALNAYFRGTPAAERRRANCARIRHLKDDHARRLARFILAAAPTA